MPSRVRKYSGDATVLVACSICPRRVEFPTEIRLCADKLWRCDDHWGETTMVEEDRAVAASRKRLAEQELRFPFPAGWVES